jgi:prepilin peptidase CpaA
MTLILAFKIAFFGILLAAAVQDIMSFTISDWFSAALIILFVPWVMVSKIDLGIHVLTGMAMFLIGLLAFHFNIMGGGDIKLLCALGFWAGPLGMIWVLGAIFLAGGGVALFILVWHKISASEPRENQIPYAVAILLGTFFSRQMIPVFS